MVDINSVGRTFLPEIEEVLGTKLRNFRIRVADPRKHTFYKFPDDYAKFSTDGFHIIGLYTGADGNPKLYNDRLTLYHCYPNDDDTNEIKIKDCTIIHDFGIRNFSFPDSKKSEKQTVVTPKKRTQVVQELDGDNISYDTLTARDRVCIELCVPGTSKPWLNDLIKKGLSVKMGTFK
jgi:hypothetical protein